VRDLFAAAALSLVVAGCGAPSSTDTPSPPEEAPATAAAVAATNLGSADDDAGASVEEAVLVDLLEQDIPYGEGSNGNLMGFLAVPADAAEPLPGVLVLHEWWGLNDQIRDATRRIARSGYVVLAVDFYGGRTAETTTAAQALLRELVAAPEEVRDNLRQAYDYVERYALAPRIASVGWDLGGRWSMQTALMFPQDLDAVAIIYGSVETDEALLETLQMPILGLFGETDASIPVRDVQTFRSTLSRLGKTADVRIYSNAGHGFFFADSENYDPIAADDGWNRLMTLLNSALKN